MSAAGIINGIGHYWGYRNFEAPDASTNISPWGIVIGGEELHNNHHTYPTSAKFSVKPYEFDIGWVYISLMQKIGLATVKKVPPKLRLGTIKPVADEKTLEAVIANRYEVMARYGREMRLACKAEIEVFKAKGQDLATLKAAKRWLHRDEERVPAAARQQLARCVPSTRRWTRWSDARRAAPDVAQHQPLARAAGQRPAGLAAGPRKAGSRRCASSR